MRVTEILRPPRRDPFRRGLGPVPRGLLSQILLVLLIPGAGGCYSASHSTIMSLGGEEAGEKIDEAPESQRIAALRDEFIRLDESVDPAEAELLASTAIRYSNQMAEQYDLTKPVELNNVLISSGLKRRGLCYQLAEDLLAELRTLHLKTLVLQRCMAWKGDIWNEHNCVVVTAVGQAFEDGIVLDPWRNAGNLRWAPVRLDHYPWVPKPPPAWETESQQGSPTSGPSTQPSTTTPSIIPSSAPATSL